MDDPEGNLLIVERVGHESQRRFPYWEYGWVSTAHSTEQHCIWHATHADACDPSGSASPNLPYASLRRIFRRFAGTQGDSRMLCTKVNASSLPRKDIERKGVLVNITQ